MALKAPDFWWRPAGPAARLLWPVAAGYGAVAARRMAEQGAKAGLPVICVGNVTLGGAGKTPTALALAERLLGMGERPAFLTRGYGGSLAGPVLVDPARHIAAETGDEALLLAEMAPTVVSRERPAGARLCMAEGASVIVMDDGLQNPSLAKDLAVAVFDGGRGIGNGLPFPAGPLRAPLAAQWPRIGAALVIGWGGPGRAAAGLAEEAGKPVLRARLVPDPFVAESLQGRRCLAFAGIGNPAKFFETLRGCGAELISSRAFPDHHPYKPAEIAALQAEAARDDLVLVTTAKDRARLGRRPDGAHDGIMALPVRLAFADEIEVDALLRATLARVRAVL